MRFGAAPFLSCSALAAALAAALAPAAHAAVLTAPGSIDDYEAQKRSDTGVYAASENFATSSRIGFQSNFNGTGANQPGGITSLYFFQLPALPAGETLSAATFSVGRLAETSTAATTVAPNFNADLYALGFVNAVPKTVEAAQKFFYLGNAAQTALPAGGPDVMGAVSRLVDNFFEPGDYIPAGGSPTATPDTADITSYVQGLYNNAATNGFVPGTSLLVLRLNPDADAIPTSGTQRYFTAFEGTSTNGGAGTAANRPAIMLTTVPEPAAAGVLVVGALGLLRRRRA